MRLSKMKIGQLGTRKSFAVKKLYCPRKVYLTSLVAFELFFDPEKFLL